MSTYDERFARQYRYEPPSGFPLTSPCSDIVHHLSGPTTCAHTQTSLQKSSLAVGAHVPTVTFIAHTMFDNAYLHTCMDSLVRVSRRVGEAPCMPDACGRAFHTETRLVQPSQSDRNPAPPARERGHAPATLYQHSRKLHASTLSPEGNCVLGVSTLRKRMSAMLPRFVDLHEDAGHGIR